jgi:hypothetical protein
MESSRIMTDLGDCDDDCSDACVLKSATNDILKPERRPSMHSCSCDDPMSQNDTKRARRCIWTSIRKIFPSLCILCNSPIPMPRQAPQSLDSGARPYTDKHGIIMIHAPESQFAHIFSVYGRTLPLHRRLRFVSGRSAIYQMLTAYCRITQTGT